MVLPGQIRLKTKKRKGFRERAPGVWAALVTRSGGHCELRASSACTGIGQDAHHLVGRGVGGPDTLENTAMSCRPCNEYVETIGQLAYDRGWKIRSTSERGRALLRKE